MKITKKAVVIATVTAIVLSNILGGTSLIAVAESYSDMMTYESLSYKKVDEDEDKKYDYIEISTCDSSATDVVIPATIEGLPVTSIEGTAFSGCTNLKSIKIPDSVTLIGYMAFYGCRSLTSIEIGNGVTSIGYMAFSGCTSLTSIEIPESVTSIADSAFSDCTKLTSIVIPKSVTSIGEKAFDNTALLKNQTGVKYADKWIIDCDKDVENAKIKDGTIGIANNAFYGCTKLTSIEIPESVTSIGYKAFYDCMNLKIIEIPESVTSIGDYTFYNCECLISIEIPDSVTSIGRGAFSGCTNLTSIEIPDSVTSVGMGAFSGCTNLSSVTIPENVTLIGNDVFSGCKSLKHNFIHNSEKKPTCTENGNIEYWYCTKCDEYFIDKACENKVSKEYTIISATGHSFTK